jgi:hypothetical protein
MDITGQSKEKVTLEEKLLIPTHITDRLLVTEKTIYRWLDGGKLKGNKLGAYVSAIRKGITAAIPILNCCFPLDEED